MNHMRTRVPGGANDDFERKPKSAPCTVAIDDPNDIDDIFRDPPPRRVMASADISDVDLDAHFMAVRRATVSHVWTFEVHCNQITLTRARTLEP